ncbi:MAG TPA: hypothetical protein VGC06_07940 [Actinomycetes bacterium]
MVAVLRSLFVLSAAAFRLAASPRRLAEQKHWPSDGIARQAFLAATAISAVVLLAASAIHPNKLIWS